MKLFSCYLILAIPLVSFSQTKNTIDLISRNLIQIDKFKSLEVGTTEFKKEDNSEKLIVINECFEAGDFYVSSRDKNSILVSNINTPQSIDSILPAAYPYGGSIGIISHEGTLINSRFDSVSYYSQNGWAYYGHYSDTGDLINCAGGNKTVFYMGVHLWHLNGADQPQLIYENIHYSCADLVVDSFERAWVITGTQWPISDTLRVIDSTGYQVCKFPFQEPFNTINAYGMMMNQNKIWLGVGDGNPLYPGKLLPLEIVNNEVIAGTAIDFPDMFYLDLESCEVGLPKFNCFTTSTEESIIKNNSTKSFPNPSSKMINVTSDLTLNKIEIINLSGNILTTFYPNNEEIQINIENLSSGIYFIRLYSDKQVEILKQIKR